MKQIVIMAAALAMLVATGCGPAVGTDGLTDQQRTQAAFAARVEASREAAAGEFAREDAARQREQADAAYSGRIIAEMITDNCRQRDIGAVKQVIENATTFSKAEDEKQYAQRDGDRGAVSALDAKGDLLRNESLVLESRMDPKCSAAVSASVKFEQ